MNPRINHLAIKRSPLFPIFLTVFLSFILFSACSDQKEIISNPPSSDRGYLLSYTKTGSMTADEIISINQEEGNISAYANYDVDLYSIVYNSIFEGEILEVSGLVIIPKNSNSNLRLVQNHHGTIIPGFGDGETPSTYSGGLNGSSEMYFVGATLASNGYIVSMPDYVGYGITRDKEHPYTMHRELAEVSIDMLRATKKLLSNLSKSFSNNVFLTGWSEGGGAGLATHKYLQEIYPGEFNVVASSLLAGPYDYYGFLQDIFRNADREDEELSIYNWSVYSLNKYNSSLNQNASNIWSYEVTNQIDALDIPSTKPSDIFLSSFVNGVIEGANTDFIAAARANTLLEGWIPQGHLFFHSGTNDLIVPHYNSTNAHQYFQSINASSTLYEYVDGDHYTPLYDYLTTTLDDFNEL